MSRRIGVPAAFIISFIVMLLGRTGLLYDLELKSYDYRFQLRGPESVDHSDAVVVLVDDESLATLPRKWPLPRSYHAKLIKNLLKAGARLIVFDIQFTEPDLPEEDSTLAAATASLPRKSFIAGNWLIIQPGSG